MVRFVVLFIMVLLCSNLARAQGLDVFNADFTNEWGPTRFNSAGHPDGYSDCGPTSLLMAAAYLGLMPSPKPETAESEIREVRILTRGKPTPISGPTYTPMMIRGALALGAKIEQIHADAMSVRAALASRKLVLIAGDPRTGWGLEQNAKRQYLHNYGAAGPIPPPADGRANIDHFGHWVVVFANSANGQFLIGDPLSTVGVIEVTSVALDQYFAEWPIMTAALAISR